MCKKKNQSHIQPVTLASIKRKLISSTSKLVYSQWRGREIFQQLLQVRFLIGVTALGNHLTRIPSESDTRLYCSFLREKFIWGAGLKYLSSADQTLIKLDLELYWCWVCSSCFNCSSAIWWQSNVHTDVKVSTMRLLPIGCLLLRKDKSVSLTDFPFQLLHTQK